MKNLEQKSSFTPKTEDEEEYLTRQFHNPKKLNLNGEDIEVVDISPREIKKEIPTLILPGFSATPLALKDMIVRTAEQGRRVISADAPHGINIKDRQSDLPDAEMRKLELVLKMIETSGLKQVNVIGHSESAIYITAAAALYPEKFANIVLIEPAGLQGKDNPLSLLFRFLEDRKEDSNQSTNFKKVKFPSPNVGVHSVLSDVVASAKELHAISKVDISRVLEKIRESGVKVSVIHAVDDKLFPMEKIQEKITAEMVDGFYSIKGTHNNIYTYEPFGRAAEAALTALENKSVK